LEDEIHARANSIQPGSSKVMKIARQLFDWADTDGTGVIDTSELGEVIELFYQRIAVRRLPRDEIQQAVTQLMEDFDADNNGVLDFEEWLQMLATEPWSDMLPEGVDKEELGRLARSTPARTMTVRVDMKLLGSPHNSELIQTTFYREYEQRVGVASNALYITAIQESAINPLIRYVSLLVTTASPKHVRDQTMAMSGGFLANFAVCKWIKFTGDATAETLPVLIICDCDFEGAPEDFSMKDSALLRDLQSAAGLDKDSFQAVQHEPRLPGDPLRIVLEVITIETTALMSRLAELHGCSIGALKLISATRR